MDQERIGALIKDIRKKNNLSQSAFAKKYGVTYQAVSKWENGKNIPDLSIIKQICSDYNISLEELLDGTTKETIKNKKLIPVILFLIGIIAMALGLLFLTTQEPKDNFEFKTLSSQSSEFTLTGSIAYNQDKTSIYISNVEYKGKDNNIEYKGGLPYGQHSIHLERPEALFWYAAEFYPLRIVGGPAVCVCRIPEYQRR